MEWNNGSEWRKFQREQEKLRKEYLAAGMTEEQIQAIYNRDKDWFYSRKREALHTQKLDIQTSEDEDRYMENPLYKKFLDNFSVNDKYEDYSRYGWIDDIKDERLYSALKKLSDGDLEIITRIYVYGQTQSQVAEIKGVKKAAISRKLGRLKDFLKNFLSDVNF